MNSCNRFPWLAVFGAALGGVLAIGVVLNLGRCASAGEETLMVKFAGVCVDEAGDPVADVVVTLHRSEFHTQKKEAIEP